MATLNIKKAPKNGNLSTKLTEKQIEKIERLAKKIMLLNLG